MIPDSKLHKLINGALHSAIQAHGPITKEKISSAARRVANQIVGFIKDGELERIKKQVAGEIVAKTKLENQ